MKVTNKQLRRIIREEITKEEEAESKTAAGKKLDIAMDSSALNAFKVALDKANNKDAVKETLQQIFSALGENGQKYLKQALKELAQEI